MQKNDFIRIRYIAKIKENNLEFDKNEDMPLVVGAGWVLKGLDDGILDMNVSDKKAKLKLYMNPCYVIHRVFEDIRSEAITAPIST